MSSLKKVEYVLAVHRDQFTLQNIGLHGIYPVDLNAIGQNDYCFLPRHIISNKSAQSIMVGSIFPQICGYFQIVNQHGEYLVYQRKGKEGGLLGKYSIGVGGHVDIDDYISLQNYFGDDREIPLLDLIGFSSKREIEEELGIELPAETFSHSNIDFKNVISLSVDPTNIIHLGLPAIVNVDTDTLKLNHNPDELIDLQWMSVEEIKNSDFNFEAWSKLLIELM